MHKKSALRAAGAKRLSSFVLKHTTVEFFCRLQYLQVARFSKKIAQSALLETADLRRFL
jgi:hypothetical protein